MSERHRFGLSTCWNGSRQTRPADLLDEHERLGFRRLEAYALHTPDNLAELGALARERDFEITSLHAPCPIAVDERGHARALGRLARLDQPDGPPFAVDTVKRTIDAAAELGARGIVIHLGTTSSLVAPADDRGHDRAGRPQQPGPPPARGAGAARPRGEQGPAPGRRRSAASASWASTPSARRSGWASRRATCTRRSRAWTRWARCWTPAPGLPVGYWHDAGHGAKLEYCGFWEHEEYLRRYGDRLVGMHVHDTQLARDHRAPGSGHDRLRDAGEVRAPGHDPDPGAARRRAGRAHQPGAWRCCWTLGMGPDGVAR